MRKMTEHPIGTTTYQIEKTVTKLMDKQQCQNVVNSTKGYDIHLWSLGVDEITFQPTMVLCFTKPGDRLSNALFYEITPEFCYEFGIQPIEPLFSDKPNSVTETIR